MHEVRHVDRRAVRGFTFVELLVVIVLMVAVVSVLVEIFGSADDMVGRSGGRAVTDNQARLALRTISSDLCEAIADRNFSLSITNADITYAYPASAIYAVTLASDPGTGRAARVVGYEVRPSARHTGRYDLVRRVAEIPTSGPGSVTTVYEGQSLTNALAGGTTTVLARDVALFCAMAFDSNRDEVVFDWNRSNVGLPRYVDVYLELLDERDAVKVADLQRGETNGVALARVDEWARHYTTRIHFDNRYGYRDRK